MGNTTAFEMSKLELLSRYVNSFGRSFYQIIFPESISVQYLQATPVNFIGLILFIVLMFLVYRVKGIKTCICIISLYLILHITTIVAYVIDTYLYMPLFITLISILYLVENQKLNTKRMLVLPIIAVSLLYIKSFKTVEMWYSLENLWIKSFENENSPKVGFNLSSVIRGKDIKLSDRLIIENIKAINFSENYIEYNNEYRYFLSVMSFSESMTNEEKIEVLASNNFPNTRYDLTINLVALQIPGKYRDMATSEYRRNLIYKYKYLKNEYRNESYVKGYSAKINQICEQDKALEKICNEIQF